MKWMIRADMEGLTGVVSMKQVVPGASDYAYGHRMLQHDLQAVLAGLLQEEHDRVVIYDIHFWGTNIDLEGLDPRVQVICGKPDYTPDNGGWLDASYDGVILLGLHAKSGTPDAVLAHNYEHDIAAMSLNGLSVGEIGLEAAVAGESGVPLVLVTGDSDGAREAEQLLPGVVTVTVKQSTGAASAICDPPSVTGGRLREGAAACRNIAASLSPFRVQAPIELEMTFHPGELLVKLQQRLKGSFVSAYTLVLRGDSVLAVWEQYLKAKA